jgi:putative ABC transport system substrate-binding protein
MVKAETGGTGIPVVFANCFTEDTGLVDSVRQPGGNNTGVRWGGPDLHKHALCCHCIRHTSAVML